MLPTTLSEGQEFIRMLLRDPRRTGALAPSGPVLARKIARALNPKIPGHVVELGPGTGPVTKALIARGFSPERLVLIEYDAKASQRLADHYRPAHVICGDAYALRQTLGEEIKEPIAGIVSSLPLLNQRPQQRCDLLDEAFDLMGKDGIFVQFTYGLASSIPIKLCKGRYRAKRSLVLRNFPPASVWVYRTCGPRLA